MQAVAMPGDRWLSKAKPTMASSNEIEAIQRQLADLDAQRQQLEARLRELQHPPDGSEMAAQFASGLAPERTGNLYAVDGPGSSEQIKSSRATGLQSVSEPTVTNTSPAAEKIALFRRLFGGRTDVFPVRWDNPKTSRSGYARAPIVAHFRAA